MITITPKKNLESFVELPSQLSELLINAEIDQILKIKIRNGRSERTFQELFDLHENTHPTIEAEVLFEGDFSKVHGIGRNWNEGKFHVLGNTGDCLGEQMTGGTLVVEGNTGDCTARGMSGGRLIIQANAGDHLGSFCPGSMKGMTGGEVFVQGSVGQFCGHRMRRGTIIIGESSGSRLGYEMLAGTIVCCGPIPDTVGLNMVRGTILILNPANLSAMSHLEEAVQYEPAVFRLLLKYLNLNKMLPTSIDPTTSHFTRYLGDMTMDKRGEVLIAS
ncbi:formylmethanofuran dehydrogenase subunit C [Rubinisphaera italica]|uniref:Formyltransferase/hydrolase complex Fhc subunit C n=1 Tax=Rubinisphaera italica TaxID=2527969 RepID=A0A5C5XIF7_9PLAN|nr:formylmethanofuran dehydrogenase subunit C [Rubinisphaera italica]TWT61602.1 Formyltransferase/hydrolase complex Fhc subunit C [Rubinisphaera italica]